jgi:hypothetical protein
VFDFRKDGTIVDRAFASGKYEGGWCIKKERNIIAEKGLYEEARTLVDSHSLLLQMTPITA